MRTLKKIGLLFALFFVAALDIFVYWNSHFYYEAKREEDKKTKIDYLERSNRFAPLNDLVFYELGKSYFDLGVENFNNAEAGDSFFRSSAQNLKRSIAINPASPYAHYYLAQSLLHLSFFPPGDEIGFMSEFRKAALLAGEDSQLFFEVSKIFLSRWLNLSPEDRDFTLDILRKIMARKDSSQVALLMSIWEMNVGDFSVMERVLPEDPQILRIYARFLGEKSLSLAERQKFLARAEQLEFARARRRQELGETALFNFQIQEAGDYFALAQNLLGGIKFYQTLVAQNLIDNAEFINLRKDIWLDLSKCRIEEKAKLGEVKDYLLEYLSLEDQPKKIGDLEEYLRNRGVLPGRFSQSFDDLGRLAFELLLQFKQTRYRDIMSVGRMLEGSFVVIPEAKKKDYVSILQLIGDSYQKADYLYDAGDIYQKALEVDPANLETLLRIRQNYDRLSAESKIREVDRTIERIVTPRNIEFKSTRINKAGTFSRTLIFDGKKINLELNFKINETSVSPLLSVFFNGRVVWEDYLRSETISLDLETRAGENILEILPVNAPVLLLRLAWRPGNGNKNLPPLRSTK